MTRLAVVGAGMMGQALSRGLLRAGWRPDDLLLTDVRSDHVRTVGRELGVPVAADNAEAAGCGAPVLLAVKPQDAAAALDGLTKAAGVISIVAGLRVVAIEAALGDGAQVVRAMPNTPASVGKGVTALAAGRGAGEDLRGVASEVFGSVGPVVWVPEHQLDAVTALSGSGPAYVFLVAEAMVDAGVALGLSRDVAETLAFATVEGAGHMLASAGQHPAVLRSQVTSPGGTTAAALAVLEAMAVRSAFIEAITAAEERSRELGG